MGKEGEESKLVRQERREIDTTGKEGASVLQKRKNAQNHAGSLGEKKTFGVLR